MTTPADELRAAAEKLRALATAASTATDGTPTANWNVKYKEFQSPGHGLLCGDYITNGRGERVGWPLLNRGGSQHRPTYMATQHAEYAAAMDPTVGLALAKALGEAAASVEQDGGIVQDSTTEALLDVARSINGSQP
ncbi:hypothetical protein [Streptomyces sp. NPDC020607]|uniref:hypothetical protein n=1 Tax=Streptomyces sp. NPDC020607 TaxID=3365082 RepID=UPI0037A90564